MSQIRLSIIGDCLIEVDDCHVTPSASQVFGLLLLLGLRHGKPISRHEIQQLLLADAEGAKLVAHNLRQLLYRLRQLGLRFQQRSAGVAFDGVEILGPMEHLLRMDAPSRARLTLAELEILPAYVPRLPKPFFTWLDDVKCDIDGQIRRLLLADLETLRVAHAWPDVTRLCETLASLDASNEEVIRSRAEALAMLGQREEALRVLDQFTRENAPSANTLALLQSVRMRIAKTPIARREGTLRARASCLTFLDGEWSKLASEGARLSAIIGHAGLGKTRVAEEFAARIAFRGGHVVRFECDSQSRQQPLALFSHILPALRAMRGSLGASPAFKSALALVRPTEDCAEPTLPAEHSIDARRAEIQSALIDLLEAVTAERPMLLVVDDAHLLDDASRSVLRALTMTHNDAMLQVLVCARPASGNTTLLTPARRNSVFELAPLSREDSAALLLELRAGLSPDDDYVAWSLKQAAGNPFYLYTLASHPASSSTAVPFDISSLALSAYSSLRPESRTVLESCLLLGRFATIARAMCIAGIEDHALLAALRDLEELDLVHFVDGHLSGPHALLHDALRVLIPSSVSALLHRRIAAKLEDDCVAERFASSLAWASAQSWLAAGDSAAATHLLRRCASYAASLGEPAMGAELLSQLPISALPPTLQGELRDDLSRFADDGGCRKVAAAALRHRLRLARELGEGNNDIQALRLRIVEADILDGGPISVAAEALTDLLADASAEASVRAQAAVRLLVFADIELDSQAAELARSWVTAIVSRDPQTTAILAHAELVYHTTFGDVDRAHVLALQLLDSFPQPDAAIICTRARAYAAFALCRIGRSDRALSTMEADFEFMMVRRMNKHALYSASALAQVAINAGDFSAAHVWFAKSQLAARGVLPSELSPIAGFDGNAGLLAMRQGRYHEAEEHFLAPRRHGLLSTARLKAVALSLLLRLEQHRSAANLPPDDVALLHELYMKGRRLGDQDSIVEALWRALVLDGDTASASQLLGDYLCVHRRERSLPDWSLRNATAADDAWHAYYARANASVVAV